MKQKIIKIIILLFVSIIIVAGAYKRFFVKKTPSYVLTTVERKDIRQEVSTTGQVKKGEIIELSFENTGKINGIYVDVGDNVRKGDLLSSLQTSQLAIQLAEAGAALDIAQANLDTLMAGSTEEEIRIARTEVRGSEISLAAAKKKLNDVYTDNLNVLDSCYFEANDALNTINQVYRESFNSASLIKENKDRIQKVVDELSDAYNITENNRSQGNIDNALSAADDSLNTISKEFSDMRILFDEPAHYYLLSSTYKGYLDAQIVSLNTEITSLVNAQQAISSARLDISTAENQLQLKQDKLSLALSGPSEENIELYEAKVRQAEAGVRLLENQMGKSNLFSPVNGQIISIEKEVGETVASTQSMMISLFPENPFEIVLDVPETDISKIEVGDDCGITLDAFPEQEFLGQVIKIGPAETIIQGVVYYKVTISIDVSVKKVKSGMTANVDIVTEIRKDALVIPQRTIFNKNGDKFVNILDGEEIKEIKIDTGIRSVDGNIEILSGLKQGDSIVSFTNRENQ